MKTKRWRILLLLTIVIAIASLVLTACNNEEEPGDSLTLTVSPAELSVRVGETAVITPAVSREGLSVSWSTSEAAVATVDGGTVTGVSQGAATITASVGSITADCAVTVTAAGTPSEPTAPVFTEEEIYEGELYINNNTPAGEADLCKGLTAADYRGNPLPVTVTDDGGFDVESLGMYEVEYSATDADGRTSTFTRDVYVTYFGIVKDFMEAKSVSELDDWTYVSDSEDGKTAKEWRQQVVPGHSVNWNLFEGPEGMPYIVMRGSDTFGRAGTDGVDPEVDDEDPNTILWNKVTVGEKSTLRIFASNNPYPDYNNLLSKFRVSVIDLTDWNSEVAFDYVEIKAPLNAEGNGLDYDVIREQTFFDVDLSAYEGKTVIVLIEQDAAADVYQEDYYKDIGYLDFQIAGLIQETRDSLVVYKMGFIAAEEDVDYSGLTLDSAASWGSGDTSDYGSWGLRGDVQAKGKWTTAFLNGATGMVNFKDAAGGSLQIIAREPADRHDGGAFVRDAVTMLKTVAAEDYFVIYAGTDSDATNVNYRLSFVVDGTENHLLPVYDVPGYTRYRYGGWGNIRKSQWVEGAKLVYDVSEFRGKEVVILIEQDENWTETDAGACTLWFNYAYFTSSNIVGNADYASYDALVASLEQQGFAPEDYTEASWAKYTAALTAFLALPKNYNSDQQGYIDAAIQSMNLAVDGLVSVDEEPIEVPEDILTGTLDEPIAVYFDDDEWKSLTIDGSVAWGTDDADMSYWGLRGSTSDKAAWKHYIADNGSLHHATVLGNSLQSIAYESGNDSADDLGADAVFVNRVWVRGNKLSVWVGCDNDGDSVNVRVRLLKNDGTLIVLNPLAGEDFVPVMNGWVTISSSQWTTGSELVYDVSGYFDEVVTVLIEQDEDEGKPGTHCSMWLNKVAFSNYALEGSVGSFDDAAWKSLTVDSSSVWGTDSTDAGAWGLRGDASAKAKWRYFGSGNATLQNATGTGAGFQSIVYEVGNDTADTFGADAVFANKTVIADNKLSIFAGCDDGSGTINIRVRLVLEDGSIVTLAVAQSSDGEYAAVKDGWGKVQAGQWVYGTEIIFDTSDYTGRTATILIEQDCDDGNTATTNCTLWLTKIAFVQ